MIGNGRYVNMEKVMEKLVKPCEVNLFLVGFSHLEPLCTKLLCCASVRVSCCGTNTSVVACVIVVSRWFCLSALRQQNSDPISAGGIVKNLEGKTCPPLPLSCMLKLEMLLYFSKFCSFPLVVPLERASTCVIVVSRWFCLSTLRQQNSDPISAGGIVKTWKRKPALCCIVKLEMLLYFSKCSSFPLFAPSERAGSRKFF